MADPAEILDISITSTSTVEKISTSTNEILKISVPATVEYSYPTNVKIAAQQLQQNGKILNEDISKRQIDKQFFTDQNGKNYVKIYTNRTFYNDNGNWVTVDYATTTQEIFNQQVGYNKGNFFSDFVFSPAYADTVYSGYGECGITYNNTSWSTVHNAADGSNVGGNGTMDGVVSLKSGSNYYVTRSFYKFDTSFIGTATIDSASFFVKNRASECASGTSTIALVKSTAADSLTTADFDQSDTILQSDTTFANSDFIGGDVYNEFTLNATGILNLNASGNSKLALREYTHDILNVAPTIATEYAYFYNSTYTGTDHDPYLTVEYTVPTSTISSSTCILASGSIDDNQVYLYCFYFFSFIFIAFIILSFLFLAYKFFGVFYDRI